MELNISLRMLVGKTIEKIVVIKDEKKLGDFIYIKCVDGDRYIMEREDDMVDAYLLDGYQEIQDLVGNPILSAEESSNMEESPAYTGRYGDEEEAENNSYTWTYYIIRTIKTTVTLRWFVSSNGNYSEKMRINKVTDKYKSGHVIFLENRNLI